MPKIDLITGFLGAGKTTFIRKYAAYLISKGEHVGILENDFGAVNVDMMLLSDIESENCGLEMIAGGCCQEPAAHRRRFKTKLIAMRMDGYDRIIVEPSGIYEVDEFFDTLLDEPLDSWYEIGNVIALVDAGLEQELPPEADYLLASQISCAGAVVITKSACAAPGQIHRVKDHINRVLEETRCIKRVGDEVLCRDTDMLTDDDLSMLTCCGYMVESCAKTIYDPDHAFETLFYMHPRISSDRLGEAVRLIFADAACGGVMRVKGFLSGDGAWLELNATPDRVEVRPAAAGQEIIIVIGQDMDKEKIGEYLETPPAV